MFQLPPLPYDYAALEPTISAETMRLHHDKHHAKYFATTNDLAAKEEVKADSLEELVLEARNAGKTKLYDNAAQAWNHTFFWEVMSPQSQEVPGDLMAALEAAFRDFDGFKTAFVDAGMGQFGSGWAWLAAKGETVEIHTTANGDNLLHYDGVVPLLVCDVWEHAYYVDYRNDRKAFLEAWIDKLPNWALAGRQFAAAKGQGEPWRHPGPSREARAALPSGPTGP